MGNKQKELPTGLAIREKNRYDTIRVDNSNVFFPVIYEEFPTPPKFTLIKQYDLAKYNVKRYICKKYIIESHWKWISLHSSTCSFIQPTTFWSWS